MLALLISLAPCAIGWLIRLVVNLAMLGAAMLLAPVLPLFATDGWLPSWLSWFQTSDSSLDGEDPNFQEKVSWCKIRYLRQVLWLWRNPAYGMDDAPFMRFVVTAGSKHAMVGRPDVSNLPLRPGWVFHTYTKDGKIEAFQLYFVWDYVLFGHRCVRINLGWKMWNAFNAVGSVKSFVASINPWMKIKE